VKKVSAAFAGLNLPSAIRMFQVGNFATFRIPPTPDLVYLRRIRRECLEAEGAALTTTSKVLTEEDSLMRERERERERMAWLRLATFRQRGRRL
jgi:hypothetical protein